MTRVLLLVGWAVIVTTTLVWALAAWLVSDRLYGALTRHRLSVPVLPCDACDRLVPLDVAHSGHEPGCGYDERGQCRCDLIWCAACCPCDVVAEVHRV